MVFLTFLHVVFNRIPRTSGNHPLTWKDLDIDINILPPLLWMSEFWTTLCGHSSFQGSVSKTKITVVKRRDSVSVGVKN